MAIESSASEDASCIKEDEGRDVLETVESEDIDLAALMKRYQGTLSVSVSEEEDMPISLNQVESAASDDKDTDDVDYDELDEDEYAARANDIMQRYKMQYALSDDTEHSSESSDDDDDVEETEPPREGIVDRAEDLVNKSRQILELSKAEREREEEEEEELVDVDVANLLANVEIGEEMTFDEAALEHVNSETVTEEHVDEVESKTVEEDVLEHVESKTSVEAEEAKEEEAFEIDEEIKLETKSGSAEEEEKEVVEIDERIQLETETGPAEEEEMEDVELDQEIQEEEDEASTANVVAAEVEASTSKSVADVEASTSESVAAEVEASTSKSVAEVVASTIKSVADVVALSTSKSVAEVVALSTSKSVVEVAASSSKSVVEVAASTSKSVAETSSNDADESEELEEMITKLTKENEVLKKKKEMKKRIYELAEENDKLKMSPQRNALANMAIKFDDAVATAVAKVSKIMVCAPDDEDVFGEGFSELSEGNESGVFAVDPASDFGRLEYKQHQVLSPVSHMTDENTNFFQSAPVPPNSYQLKMQAYHQKYQDPLKPKPAVTVNDVLKEARLASGVGSNDMDDAIRRVEEAKRYIKNRSVLKTKGNF